MTLQLEKDLVSDLQVHRLGGRIGARIDGVRLSGDLDDAVVQQVRAAISKHKVVFFRGQDHLDDEARSPSPSGSAPSRPPTRRSTRAARGCYSLTANKGMAANSWHTDVTFVDRVPAFSVLRGVTIPAYGGTTNWANTVDGLRPHSPTPLKALVENLWAVHTNAYDYATATESVEATTTRIAVPPAQEFRAIELRDRAPGGAGAPRDRRARARARPLREAASSASTPLESSTLFNLLQNRVTQLENTIRWTWQQGDVAIWDNRATQHYAVADFDEQPREVRRITVAGDVPVIVDGRRSEVLVGDASGVRRHRCADQLSGSPD